MERFLGKAKEELNTNALRLSSGQDVLGVEKKRYCPEEYNMFLNNKRGEIAPPTLSLRIK